MGTFKDLIRNLPKHDVHGRNLVKPPVFCNEVVNVTQLLEKAEYGCIAIRLS
jgi:hypothetical protein